MRSGRILIGEITTVHGVRGLLKVRVFGGDAALLNGLLYTKESGETAVNLTLKNTMGDVFLAEIEGVADRTAAEKFRGTKLYVPREKLPAIREKNTYYHVDLIGLQAIDTSGNAVGRVIAVQNFGAGDLLDIQPAQGPSFYLSFTTDNVPKVDLETGTMTVVIPEEEAGPI